MCFTQTMVSRDNRVVVFFGNLDARGRDRSRNVHPPTMKHETEFRQFLTTEKLSSRTNRPFSPKVASDTISRCRTVERLMSLELSGKTLGSDAAASRLCAQITAARVSSTVGRPYAHNELVLAVRTYREFIARFAS